MGGARVMVPYPLNVWEMIVVPHPPLQMLALSNIGGLSLISLIFTAIMHTSSRGGFPWSEASPSRGPASHGRARHG